jgi:transcriptional regulator with XRE-family HTH domain
MVFSNVKTGKYIMILRKTRGLTQKALADCLGLSHQAVSSWERGETMPDIATLPLLAELLGTTSDAILSASNDDFTGFDEIISRVNLVRKQKPERNTAVRDYLATVLQQLDQMLLQEQEDEH